MTRAVLALALALCGATLTACAQDPADGRSSRVPIVGLPCEGCEGVFEGLPARLSSVSTIAPSGEPGPRMVIDGVVRDAGGRPAAGVIVYAYQTDSAGAYRPGDEAPGSWARRHGVLRGWAMTDSLGRYRFLTIRPGHYPGRSEAAHVHVHVIEPSCCTYYIDEILFDDDPLLSDSERREARTGRGGSGLTSPTRDADGTWHVTRDIQLGADVPGYGDGSRPRP